MVLVWLTALSKDSEPLTPEGCNKYKDSHLLELEAYYMVLRNRLAKLLSQTPSLPTQRIHIEVSCQKIQQPLRFVIGNPFCFGNAPGLLNEPIPVYVCCQFLQYNPNGKQVMLNLL